MLLELGAMAVGAVLILRGVAQTGEPATGPDGSGSLPPQADRAALQSLNRADPEQVRLWQRMHKERTRTADYGKAVSNVARAWGEPATAIMARFPRGAWELLRPRRGEAAYKEAAPPSKVIQAAEEVFSGWVPTFSGGSYQGISVTEVPRDPYAFIGWNLLQTGKADTLVGGQFAIIKPPALSANPAYQALKSYVQRVLLAHGVLWRDLPKGVDPR